MSTSQLFALRNKIQKNSLHQFQRLIREDSKKLNLIETSNLFLHVYNLKDPKKDIIQYLHYFAEFDKNIMHVEINQGRRLLEELCFCTRKEDIRDLIQLFIDMKIPFKSYSLSRLICLAVDGREKHNQDSICGLLKELDYHRTLFPEEEGFEKKDRCYPCLKALKKDMFFAAVEILKSGMGMLTAQNEELFNLPSKTNKKDTKLFESFLNLFFERTRTNPYAKDAQGHWFWHKMSKQLQQIVQDIIQGMQTKIQQKEPVRRSENKVRSSMSQGENVKPYNSEVQLDNSREKMGFNIATSEDEFSIQREASKIYENHVTEKEKYYKYEKKQKKEQTSKAKRVGIMKSEELRYSLDEDIRLEVDAIKQENRQYKCHFIDLINKLKQKLSTPLSINLEVFGSFRTELCLQESDIDIAITSENEQFRLNPLTLLGEIEFILQQQEMKEYIDNVKFIKTATVPIIKVTCTEKYWKKKIDFTYQNLGHNGLQSVELIRHYLQTYPQLESLIFVLKKFIYISNLSAPYLGGISSYGLILMIVAFIQQEYKAHEGDGERLLVSDLLIGFLKFYGFKMNYVMKSIQIFDQNKISWQNYNGCLTRYNDPNSMIDFTPKLVIIDPLNENNNVGRATHKIKQIQMAFEIAYISIHTFRQCGKKRKCQSYRTINKLKLPDIKYADNSRPCCILKRMFRCTEKFIEI